MNPRHSESANPLGEVQPHRRPGMRSPWLEAMKGARQSASGCMAYLARAISTPSLLKTALRHYGADLKSIRISLSGNDGCGVGKAPHFVELRNVTPGAGEPVGAAGPVAPSAPARTPVRPGLQ